jgi:hypothetical protein
MPMVPAVAILACTRIGAIHSVVFRGFGASALAERTLDAGSKVLVTADLGSRPGKEVRLKDVADEALQTPSEIQKVVVFNRGSKERQMKQGRGTYWEEAVDAGKSEKNDYLPVESNDLAFILHTSATTAKPKLTTGILEVDSLLAGGVELGTFSPFYSDSEPFVDRILYNLLYNCQLSQERYGYDAKAIFLNCGNYGQEQALLDLEPATRLLRANGVDRPTLLI